MFTLLMKRTVIFIMLAISLFTSGGGKLYADYCGNYDFPRIVAEQQAENTLRIMSYNIRCADVCGVEMPLRIDIAVRQILEIMPDSFGVQEATPAWMAALGTMLPAYGWVGINRENGGSPLETGESCPVFYLKSKFILEDSGNFWISDTPDTPSLGPGAACKRICTWAKLRDRATGREYVHVNTHFDHISEEARVQGGKILTGFIEEHFEGIPVVFTADMNTNEKGEAYATMTQNLTDARFAAEDCKTYGTFHGGGDPEKRADYYIDFVLCSADFTVSAYRTVTKGVDNRFTSDHFPIYADLVFAQ